MRRFYTLAAAISVAAPDSCGVVRPSRFSTVLLASGGMKTHRRGPSEEDGMDFFYYRQYLGIAAALVATIIVALASADATCAQPSAPRMRSGDQVLAALIERGARESATFRTLLATLDMTN